MNAIQGFLLFCVIILLGAGGYAVIIFNADAMEKENKLIADIVEKSQPLTPEEQIAGIRVCEQQRGWTGKPVTFNNIVLQIRCVKK